jgi:hypothetical protein
LRDERGYTVTLTATVGAGTNVGYTWAFGDGATGSGAVVTHTYAGTGNYTAVVTASNPSRCAPGTYRSVGTITTTTPVTITTPAPVTVTRTITYTYPRKSRTSDRCTA